VQEQAAEKDRRFAVLHPINNLLMCTTSQPSIIIDPLNRLFQPWQQQLKRIGEDLSR
jgi:hypothetical protein